MGTCCSNIKPNYVSIKSASTHDIHTDIYKLQLKKLEDSETIPGNRTIIRGKPALAGENPGQEKEIFKFGLENISFINEIGVTFSCKKGLKSNFTNQDDFSIILEKDLLILTVFDGHGIYGSEISNFLHITLPNMILSHEKFPNELENVIKETFYKCNTLLHQFCETCKISSEFSGSTCTIIFIKGFTAYVANIGDSRAVFCNSSNEVQRLTVDHKPNNPSELLRITKSEGEVRLIQCESCPRIFVRVLGC